MGTRDIECNIHFFKLPECTGSPLDDDKFATFPSWMSFLNAPDDVDDEDADDNNDFDADNTSSIEAANTEDKEQDDEVVAEANLEWGPSTCKTNSTEETAWSLVASKDIVLGDELTIMYDVSDLDEAISLAMKAGMKSAMVWTGKRVRAMKSMKAFSGMKAAQGCADDTGNPWGCRHLVNTWDNSHGCDNPHKHAYNGGKTTAELCCASCATKGCADDTGNPWGCSLFVNTWHWRNGCGSPHKHAYNGGKTTAELCCASCAKRRKNR